MERLILKIILIGLTINIVKIAVYYLNLKLNQTIRKNKGKNNTAEEIINKRFIATALTDEEKEELDLFKTSFSKLLRSKKISRKEILKIRDYIRKNVKYPQKKFMFKIIIFN